MVGGMSRQILGPEQSGRLAKAEVAILPPIHAKAGRIVPDIIPDMIKHDDDGKYDDFDIIDSLVFFLSTAVPSFIFLFYWGDAKILFSVQRKI